MCVNGHSFVDENKNVTGTRKPFMPHAITHNTEFSEALLLSSRIKT